MPTTPEPRKDTFPSREVLRETANRLPAMDDRAELAAAIDVLSRAAFIPAEGRA